MALASTLVKGRATGVVIHLVRHQMRRIWAEWLETAMRPPKGTTGKRWSQTALAKSSGVSRETIWKILNQRTDAAEPTTAALAKALGVPQPAIVASDATAQRNAPVRPAMPRPGAEPSPMPVATGTLPAPTPGHPVEDEVMSLATRALGHAVRFVLGPEDFNNPGMCHQLAVELEAFGDRLKDRLGLAEAAADLYKAALTLRRAIGHNVKALILAALVSGTIGCGDHQPLTRPPADTVVVDVVLDGVTTNSSDPAYYWCHTAWTARATPPAVEVPYYVRIRQHTPTGDALHPLGTGTFRDSVRLGLSIQSDARYPYPWTLEWNFYADNWGTPLWGITRIDGGCVEGPTTIGGS